jgi:hypothetical protein
MTGARRQSGYPDRYHAQVRTTVSYAAWITGVTLLIAGIAVAASLYLNAPPLYAALALAVFLMFGVVGAVGAILDVRVARVIPYFPRESKRLTPTSRATPSLVISSSWMRSPRRMA